MSKIIIAGIEVRQDAEGRYSLNDLHRAAVASGSNERTKEPAKFLSSAQAFDLIVELETTQELGSLPVNKMEGRGGGTYVCLELVYAYAMWISATFHLKVIRAYDRLVRGEANELVVPKSLPEALRLAADLAEQKQIAEAERDEAVRTKAMIGSKREATAMATASAAKRMAERLSLELGHNSRQATVIAVQNALGIVYPRNVYVGLRKWCKQHGVSPVEVVDERYGAVKAWPAGAWRDVEGVDLAELFGSDLLPMVAASAAKVLPFGGAR